MARLRLDTLLAERGLAPSRSAAAGTIRAGRVRIGRGGERAAKPSQLVGPDERVELEPGRRFVSRGGLKLDAALDALGVEVQGRDCLDVGASTGGFTDCLLQRGAARVVALDVGRGQLDWSLREDERVAVIEGQNARGLEPSALPFEPELAVIDVSFISLRKLLAPVASALAAPRRIVAMVKPQFELGRGRVGKGGVVRSPEGRREAVELVVAGAEEAGLALHGAAPAGVPGPKGNREVFVHLAEAPGLSDPAAAIEAGLT
jgi:23S rRNA (cytidine1920-2'-O)/16S rRNA (cytidine1409-2'-O)-methyltransferase